MQGESLLPLLVGDENAEWRNSHYYHYYEYPGWHMVYRRRVYDGRFKLMYFYDIDEWELYDCLNDPQEMVNCYGYKAYRQTTARLHDELNRLRDFYDVPANSVKEVKGGDCIIILIIENPHRGSKYINYSKKHILIS